jgi:2-haloacid dehalogenase
MSRVIVFDVNETLLDVRALEPHFRRVFGDEKVLREWFSLLLLHSQVATLAGPYFDFATLAKAALQMTAASRQVRLTEVDIGAILNGMLSLPAHPEVPAALKMLQEAGLRLVTLTNSSQRVVDEQMSNAGIAKYFERNFSVDSVKRYKPSPEPYRMVALQLGVETTSLRMVAAHAWDIVGAMQAGSAAAFVARPGKVLFPLANLPDITAPDLTGVAEEIVRLEMET